MAINYLPGGFWIQNFKDRPFIPDQNSSLHHETWPTCWSIGRPFFRRRSFMVCRQNLRAVSPFGSLHPTMIAGVAEPIQKRTIRQVTIHQYHSSGTHLLVGLFPICSKDCYPTLSSATPDLASASRLETALDLWLPRNSFEVTSFGIGQSKVCRMDDQFFHRFSTADNQPTGNATPFIFGCSSWSGPKSSGA